MARPKNANSEKTHDRIVASARGLLESGGPEAISYRSVAGAAGVGVGTVRYYFASIEQLIEAVLIAYYERLEGVTAHYMDAIDQAPPEALPGLLEGAIRALYRLARGSRADVALRARTRTTRRLRYVESFLERGTPVLAEITGRAPSEVRLDFHSLMFVLVRWATMDRDERRLVTGAEDDVTIDSMVEGHLSSLVAQLFVPVAA